MKKGSWSWSKSSCSSQELELDLRERRVELSSHLIIHSYISFCEISELLFGNWNLLSWVTRQYWTWDSWRTCNFLGNRNFFTFLKRVYYNIGFFEAYLTVADGTVKILYNAGLVTDCLTELLETEDRQVLSTTLSSSPCLAADSGSRAPPAWRWPGSPSGYRRSCPCPRPALPGYWEPDRFLTFLDGALFWIHCLWDGLDQASIINR